MVFSKKMTSQVKRKEITVLSQIQIIRSLGDALTWLEKELQWGVNPAELRHLTGRIGELYVAMKTSGQMAPQVDQRGYDVIAASGEQISVKTITSTKHIQFNQNTFEEVHRIIILRLNIDDGDEVSIEENLDKSKLEFLELCRVDARRTNTLTHHKVKEFQFH